MRDIVIVVSTIGAIVGVIFYTKRRTGSIYKETQEQYELHLGD